MSFSNILRSFSSIRARLFFSYALIPSSLLLCKMLTQQQLMQYSSFKVLPLNCLHTTMKLLIFLLIKAFRRKILQTNIIINLNKRHKLVL